MPGIRQAHLKGDLSAFTIDSSVNLRLRTRARGGIELATDARISSTAELGAQRLHLTRPLLLLYLGNKAVVLYRGGWSSKVMVCLLLEHRHDRRRVSQGLRTLSCI